MSEQSPAHPFNGTSPTVELEGVIFTLHSESDYPFYTSQSGKLDVLLKWDTRGPVAWDYAQENGEGRRFNLFDEREARDFTLHLRLGAHRGAA